MIHLNSLKNEVKLPQVPPLLSVNNFIFKFNFCYLKAEYYSMEGNDVYVYNFNFKPIDSGIPSELQEYFGAATHSDEVSLIFGDIFSEYLIHQYQLIEKFLEN